MQKKLLSGLFWLLLANLIVKPLWILGIEVGVQNAVGNSAYGFYFSIFNLAYIFNILLDIGITNFNTRNIAQHPQLITKHLSGILSIKLLLFVLYLVVTFTVGALMGYGSDEFRLLAWLTVAQFLNSLILYLRSNLQGLLLFRWDSLFSVLDRVLMILICGCLLWAPKFSIFNFQF
ncbi:MAG: oligosaccharide flippase family protein, partial [Bacteroidales bacterium]|nr:oligosaccharide flippase family protein [Bacteroidales bacterium]